MVKDYKNISWFTLLYNIMSYEDSSINIEKKKSQPVYC